MSIFESFLGPHSGPHLGCHFGPFGAPFRPILGPLGALFEQHFRLFWLSFPGPLWNLIFWSFGGSVSVHFETLCANLWAPRSLSWTPLQSCLPFQVVLWYLSGPRGAVLAFFSVPFWISLENHFWSFGVLFRFILGLSGLFWAPRSLSWTPLQHLVCV